MDGQDNLRRPLNPKDKDDVNFGIDPNDLA